MSTLIRLGPHQSPFIMLHTHSSLWVIQAIIPIRIECCLIHQVRFRNDNGRARLCLKAELAIPRHVLDGEESPVGDNHHVQIAVGDKYAVGMFDYLGEDVLDWVEGGVLLVVIVWTCGADKDRADGAFVPFDVGGVHGFLYVGTIEIDRQPGGNDL